MRSIIVLLLATVLATTTATISAQPAPTAAPAYDPTSATLVFQLRAWQPPTVTYQDYYSPSKAASSWCQPINGIFEHGDVISFEGLRRAVAATAGVPLQWTYVFPTDEYSSKFSVNSSHGWTDSTPVTAAPAAGNTTSTTSTVPATTAAPGVTSNPNPRAFEEYPVSQVYTVWLLVRALDSNASSNEATVAPISDADRQDANKKLLAIATNVGDSTALAAAAGSAFFGLNAMDFKTPISVAPMREQTEAERRYWLGVYDDEWDRFLVGMIATTILGTAAYITAHCFIHRVKSHGGLATVEGDSVSMTDKKKKQKADDGGASSPTSPLSPTSAAPLIHEPPVPAAAKLRTDVE